MRPAAPKASSKPVWAACSPLLRLVGAEGGSGKAGRHAASLRGLPPRPSRRPGSLAAAAAGALPVPTRAHALRAPRRLAAQTPWARCPPQPAAPPAGYEALIQEGLRDQGLDLELVPLASLDDRVPALLNGTVDAVMASETRWAGAGPAGGVPAWRARAAQRPLVHVGGRQGAAAGAGAARRHGCAAIAVTRPPPPPRLLGHARARGQH